MNEYIFEIENALCNKETGEVVVMPKCRGELIRCKNCIHADDSGAQFICLLHGIGIDDEDYCSWAWEKEE